MKGDGFVRTLRVHEQSGRLDDREPADALCEDCDLFVRVDSSEYHRRATSTQLERAIAFGGAL